MNLEEFRSIAEAHRDRARFVVPVYKRLSADLLTPVSAFLALRTGSHHAFLLESVEGGENLARYSFLGKNPYRVIRVHGRAVEVTERHNPSDKSPPQGDIFVVLQHYIQEYYEVRVHGLPRLRCGAVGYMGYDNVRLIEHLPDMPEDDLHVPDALWCFYDTMCAFDHVQHQIVLMASVFMTSDTSVEAQFLEAQARLAQLETELRTPIRAPAPITLNRDRLSSNFEREAFKSAIEEGKRLIYEGDIFQVVLSQRFSLPFSVDAFNLYRALRQINPSPYLFFLDFDEVTLIGSSPEVLVRVEEGRAQLLPIAGTRPRGRDAAEDLRLQEELLRDPKERAEHLMLVDLGRNDLGRICTMGSVTVDRYAYIERYSHVMHIVSTVSGEVDPAYAPLDVLRACFPAGTVSGAPKVRAMEIIDALEPTKRGIYAGAVGYIDFSGNMDTCIAIRTMVVRNNTVYIQAGAGIVADSDPEREFEETENKARALKQALRVAAAGLL